MKRELKLTIVMALVCLALSLLAYANTIPNPFIWDDEGLIVGNPSIGNIGGWYRVFTSDLYSNTLAGSNFYRPLQFISFMLDYHVWQLNPAGYHISNILLHALVSFLVFLFLFEVSANLEVSAAATLLFAAHPLHTESVAYIAGRADMLMAIALLGAFLLFTRSESRAGWSRLVFFTASLAGFVAGLLSKELAVFFPFIILAWVIYYRPKNFARPWYVLSRIVPFFVVSAVYGLLRYTVLKFTTLWQPELAQYPFGLRVMMLPKVIGAYIKILFYPVGLHMSRTMFRPLTAVDMMLYGVGAGIILLCAVVFLCKWRGKPLAGFLSAWFCIFFLPQSGIFSINAFVAEHFIYLPSIAVFFGSAYFMRRFMQPRGWRLLIAGLTVVLAVFTISRNFEWRNPVVFYQGILKHSPESFRAHINLGVQYDRRGDYENAEKEFKEAVRIRPDRIESQSDLAVIYGKMHRYEDALRAYHTVEALIPPNEAGEIQVNIGNVYLSLNDYDKALARYALALKFNPSLFAAHFNRAMIYRERLDFDRASEEIIASFPIQFYDSVRVPEVRRMLLDFIKEPSDAPMAAVPFYTQLGIRASGLNLLDVSLACMRQAVTLDRMSADAHFNLALVYMKLGRMKETRQELKGAVRLEPGHSRANGLLRELQNKQYKANDI